MIPVISVGMPVYNGARHIGEAVESLLKQTRGDFELIISDNASVDGTQAICTDFARRDQRIRYFRQRKNIGVTRNYNFVCRQSVGKYFKWAAANDLCEPLLLERCARELDAHPEVVLCWGQTRYIGGTAPSQDDTQFLRLRSPRPSDRFLEVVERFYLNNAYGGLFRSAVLKRTKLEEPYPGTDMVVLAEVALYGTLAVLPEVLHYRRLTADSSTVYRTKEAIWDMHRPGQKCRLYLSESRRLFGYLETLAWARIGLGDKARGLRGLIRKIYHMRRQLWSELMDNWR
jgi:glycosyltransferase involved in cell wall biosynthesis